MSVFEKNVYLIEFFSGNLTWINFFLNKILVFRGFLGGPGKLLNLTFCKKLSKRNTEI